MLNIISKLENGKPGSSGLSLVSRLILGIGLMLGAESAVAADFVIGANGDPFEAMWRKKLVPEFEAQTGFHVVWSPAPGAQTLAKVISQRPNPQIDIVMVDEPQFVQGRQLGLWEPLTAADLGDTSKIVPSALFYNEGIAYGFSSVGIYYNTKLFEKQGLTPPTSWYDLLKPEYKKKITIPSSNNTAGINMLIGLNQIAGGQMPDKMDPGFEFAKKLGQQALAIDNYGDAPQLIQQEAVFAGVWVQQRVNGLAAAGVPIKFVEPKEGIWGHRLMAAIVKGRPPENTAAAKRWIALMLTKDVQVSSAMLNPLPSNSEATTPDQVDMIKRVNFSDQTKIYSKLPEWIERWSREVEQR